MKIDTKIKNAGRTPKLKPLPPTKKPSGGVLVIPTIYVRAKRLPPLPQKATKTPPTTERFIKKMLWGLINIIRRVGGAK